MRFFPDYPILDLKTYEISDYPDNLEDLKKLVKQADNDTVCKYLLLALRNLPWLAYQLESETAQADNLRAYLEKRSDELIESYMENIQYVDSRVDDRRYDKGWVWEEEIEKVWNEFFLRLEVDFNSLIERAYLHDSGPLYLDLIWKYAMALKKMLPYQNEWVEFLGWGDKPGEFLHENRKSMSQERKEQLAKWFISKENDPIFDEYPDWKKDFLLEDRY